MKITLCILILLSFLFSQMAQETQKPLYYPTGNEANVAGTITLKGTPGVRRN